MRLTSPGRRSPRAVPSLLLGLLLTLSASTALANPGFRFKTTTTWETGYCAEMRVANTTGTALNGWAVTFELIPGMTIASLWRGHWSMEGGRHTVRNQDWNGSLPPGAEAFFGFCGHHTGTIRPPLHCTLNGQPCGGGQTSPPSTGAKKLVGYFIRWGVYERAFYAKSVEARGAAAKLTHLHYAFGNVVNGRCGILPAPHGDPWADYLMGFDAANSVDGQADTASQPLKGNFNQLRKLKARYPHLKVLISLGGWTWSGGFSDAVSTAEKRQAFVQSCVDLYIRGNLPGLPAGEAAGIFDGIDVDWEFPAAGGLFPGRPEDTRNFTLMMAEFRRQLDAVRPGLLLSFATSSAPNVYSKIELSAVHPYVDYINIMTYDMHGGWERTTNFHAPLYNPSGNPAKALRDSTHEAVQGHLDAGVPASKLLMGVPFYGRGWQGAPPGPTGDGLYQSSGGPAWGNWDTSGSGATGVFDYHYIQSALEPSGGKHRHPEAQVPYLYHPTTGLWVSYDDPTSLGVKGDYVLRHDLAGVMIWELSGDDAQGSLITTLKNKLNP